MMEAVTVAVDKVVGRTIVVAVVVVHNTVVVENGLDPLYSSCWLTFLDLDG